MKSIIEINLAEFAHTVSRLRLLRLSIVTFLLSLCFCQIMFAQSNFDLALTISPTQDEPVSPGEMANFTIEVFNQGDIPAQNIKVVDYIPEGLKFTSVGNTGWSSIGSRAITTITQVIMPGESQQVFLNLLLEPDANPHNISNYAEIALTQDDQGNDTTNDDIDSSADSDDDNDAGAFPFTETDDYIDGTGILDEDDHDVALLIICGQNACNDQVNISLNANCSIEILADMIVENPDYPDGAYTVVLEDEEGNVLPSNMVDGSHVGMTLKVTAFIPGCESSGCWGFATIEDKFAIELFCQVDTVDCGDEDPAILGLPLSPGETYYPYGENSFVVPGVNGCSDIILSYEDDIEMLPCQTGSPYVARVYREWIAVDGVGNENSCTSVIYVRKGNLSDVIPPPDFINNPLACGEYQQLANGNPDPNETGFPVGTSCANIISVFEDLEIPSGTCPGIFDIVREWTVVDWCNGEDTTFQQVIKIMDNEAPTCNAPSLFTAPSNADNCMGDIEVVDPTLIDNCSNTSYTIAYKPFTNFNNNFNDLITDGVEGSNSNYTITDLEVGLYRIAYFATDDCGNTSQCMGTFEIKDEQVPTPICIIETSVTLDGSGYASIEAIDLDNGSIDNCAIDRFRVRRMEANCGFSNTQFKSSTNFCCEDAGQTVMVVFRVYDEAGNFNDCMVAVTVIDDQIPTIICPADLTLTCSEYDAYNQNLPISLTGEPFTNDNCDLERDYFDTKAFNECGVGIVVRNWSVTDHAGNLATCKQYIEIESDFQFESNMIQWPADTEVNQCLGEEIDPDATGLPILPSETCSSFTIDFTDQIIQTTGSGCGVVERTFVITDNCALDPNNNSFSYIQEIEIFENEDPVFDVCEDITINANDEDCSANINYTANATDNCSPSFALDYSYTVDYFNDGSVDEQSTGKTLNGTYPSGTHRAVFFSTDECGNTGNCAFLFTILDGKNPTPICLPVSVTLDDDGEVEIWASDFNHKSFDNCTAEDDLVFSFSPDIDDQVRIFDCDDLTNGVNGVVSIQMYVWDQAGNFDYCTVTLTITDSQNVCPDAGTITADLSGKIMNMEDEDFSSVEVYIEGESMETKMKISDDAGGYIFDALSLYDNYTVTPSKNDDALNGVTTLDIVRIQKHILGLDVFTNMQEFVAADVNNNASITGVDIIQLRRLILGLYENDELPDNDSWRFIPTVFEWNDAFPFEFPEQIQINNLLESQDSLMFYGIKVGDVNGTALLNLTSEMADTRSKPELLVIEDQRLMREEIISIPVRIQNTMNVEGFQIALDFDPSIVQVIAVNSPLLELDDENYRIIGNTVFISWDKIGGVYLEEQDVLFTLDVSAKRNGLLEDQDLMLNEDFPTEIFDTNENVRDLVLELRQGEEQVKLTQLIQNQPNPFSDYTLIPFELQDEGTVQWTLMSVDGQEIRSGNRSFEAGEHALRFEGNQFEESGIYFLFLESEKWQASVKLIKVD